MSDTMPTIDDLQAIYQRAAYEPGHKHQDVGHRSAIFAVFEAGLAFEQASPMPARAEDARRRVMQEYRRLKANNVPGHGWFLYGAAVALGTTAYALLHDEAANGGEAQ